MPIFPYMLKIVNALREHEHLTTDQLVAMTGYTRATVRQAMTELRRVGYRIVCGQVFVLLKEPEDQLDR